VNIKICDLKQLWVVENLEDYRFEVNFYVYSVF